jgi:ribonucleotide reductase alpha subunit
MQVQRFKTSFAETIFNTKYRQGINDSWDALCERLVEDVCGTRWGTQPALMSKSDMADLVEHMKQMRFLAGGRYLYYAGRPHKFYNNCFLLKAEEDTREEWANLLWRASSCLMVGGGIGVDYSLLRPAGRPLSKTGGIASGPIPLMQMMNEVGRGIMQGGSRRSAIYASLNWQHEDIPDFLRSKNWSDTLRQLKEQDFNWPATLDMTNISVNYDDSSTVGGLAGNAVFMENCKQAMMTGEPGFSFNFGDKQNETLRNAPLGPDTYVLTRSGYQQIRDLVGVETRVWTGKQWAPTVFKRTAENVPVVTVCFSGGRNIVAEPTHEFILDNGERVKARDLEPGDSLLISLPNETPFTQSPKWYTVGYTYGDGSFSKKYPRAEITFCSDESRRCIDSIDRELITSITEKDARGFTRIYMGNNPVWSTRTKAVFPHDIFDLTPTEQCSFIAGLFDADGNYFEIQNRVRVSSVHEDFLQGVRRLLEQLGILSGISTAGTSTFGGKVGYTLTIYGDYVTRFGDIIPTKRLNVKEFTPYRRTKIKVKEIIDDYKRSDVYCCDVGVEEHAFMAEGVIVSNCTEVTSEDDSDVCNLGSINLGNITTLEEFRSVVALASKFLVCGTLRADLPYDKVYRVREKNRRLGLGLMGIHEWLLQRGSSYEVTPELHQWLQAYKEESEKAANEHCDRFFISRPIAYRAIAPTGTIGILASTTTGIEPLFAVAYKRRFLTEGTKWKYEYVVDATAERLINETGVDADSIDTAYKLSHDYERRIKFQADVQDYVDMSISSTINLPSWGSKGNTENDVGRFANTLAQYAPRLRGFTCYPDGSRGGQPITEVSYKDALQHKGVTYSEHDICSITGKGGSCGV